MSSIKKTFVLLTTALLIGAMYLESPYKALQDVRTCKIYIAETVEIADYITLQGKVTERLRRELYPKYPSRVLAVHVQQGQTVCKGDVLMTLCSVAEDQTAAVFYSEIRSRLESESAALQRPEVPSFVGNERVEYAIASPIDGTVMDIYYEAGERASGVFPCIAVSDLSALAVEAEISEENSGKVQPGLSCSIEVPAAQTAALEGKLSSVAPYAATGSLLEQNNAVRVRVEAEICGKASDLRPGYSAEVKIPTGHPEAQILLPYTCVGQDDGGEYVLYPDDANTLVKRYITVGRELMEGVEILAGVENGMAVIEDPESYAIGERIRPE